METSGFVALIGAIIVARIINEKGYRKLDSEEKLRLMDGFSRTRSYSMIPLLALIATFWLFSTQTNIDRRYLSIGYFGLLIVYMVARAFLNQRKLVELGLPADYRQTFTIAQGISFLGVAWFFFTIFNH